MKEDMCGNRSKTVRGQKGRARGVLVARTKNKDRRKAVARLEARTRGVLVARTKQGYRARSARGEVESQG